MIYGTSFSKLLSSSLNCYRSHLKADNFKQNLTYKEHMKYQNELSSLLDEFENRINDKFEFSALKIMIPQLLKDTNYQRENLLRDQLDTKVISLKPKIKRNGFAAIFAILQTSNGKKVEVQFSPYARYKASKVGTSAHSQMNTKQLDISPFFELKPEFRSHTTCKTLKQALETLDTTSLAQRNLLLSSSIKDLIPEQRNLKKDLEFALKSVQVKETMEDEIIIMRKNKEGSYEMKKEIRSYPIETYLPIFAQYHSPRLVAVSSPHSRTNKNTAFVNIKTLLDNFKEILLKTDETTCLADMLLKKLQDIERNDPYITLHQSAIRQILMENGISENKLDDLIQQMSNQSRIIRLPYTNSVSDIKERAQEKNAER